MQFSIAFCNYLCGSNLCKSGGNAHSPVPKALRLVHTVQFLLDQAPSVIDWHNGNHGKSIFAAVQYFETKFTGIHERKLRNKLTKFNRTIINGCKYGFPVVSIMPVNN